MASHRDLVMSPDHFKDFNAPCKHSPTAQTAQTVLSLSCLPQDSFLIHKCVALGAGSKTGVSQNVRGPLRHTGHCMPGLGHTLLAVNRV